MNHSLDLHHAPSTVTSHPTPAHHEPRATSYATVLSITHHTKGANLPWFLNLPLDECIDQHTPQIHHLKKLKKKTTKSPTKMSRPLEDRGKRLDIAETQSKAKQAKQKC